MAISKTTVEERLRPFILRNVNKDVVQLLTDTEFLLMYNDVAKDLNERAEIRIEHFYKECNTTNAEDSDLTNYLTDRPILKIYSFMFEDDDHADQIWSWDLDDNGNGVIVIKDSPASGTQLDVWYLGDLEDVADDSDEIDLPSNLLVEFLELLKKKILADYSDTQVEYERWVEYYGEKAFRKSDHHMMDGGLRRSWLGMSGDDHKYEIVDQWVSSGDNMYTDDDGIFYFYT